LSLKKSPPPQEKLQDKPPEEKPDEESGGIEDIEEEKPIEESEEIQDSDEDLGEEDEAAPAEDEEPEEVMPQESDSGDEEKDEEEYVELSEDSRPLPEDLPDNLTPDGEKDSELPSDLHPEESEAGDESQAADHPDSEQMSIFDPIEREKSDINRFIESLKQDRQKDEKDISEKEVLPPWAEEIKDKPESDEKKEPLPGKEFEAPHEAEVDSKKKFDLESLLEPDEPEKQERIVKPEEDELPVQELPEPAEGEKIKAARIRDLLDKENMFYSEKTPETPPWMETSLEEKKTAPPVRREEVKEKIERRSRSGLDRLLFWLKSRLFDMAFIALLWFGSLFLASLFLKVSVFRLISSSLAVVLIYFGILSVQYFFLFYLFLGNTLGDRFFNSPRD
jgi:hypothetical protein